MKNKIAFKLTVCFFATLLLFSLIIGGVFIMLFRTHTIEVHKADLEKRAVTMAETLSGFISGTNTGGQGSGMGRMVAGQGGYGAYLRFLDDIAMADVWIVDEHLNLITSRMAGNKLSYVDLPQDAETVVKEVFKGNTTFSEGFSNLLKTSTLTVGTPIESGGKVIGALLLHSPVEGMNEATMQGVSILVVSIVAALLLSILLSVALALAFTKPLKQMRNTAALLAGGDYTAKTDVQQNDEIGELASAIDVLSERLEQARGESEKLDKLRRDFVANVSHELKTPITVLRGSLEALCDEVVTNPTQVKDYHRQMLGESLFLQRLVNDLLDLSRLQNTDFQIEMQDIDLCDVLSDAIRSAGQMALKKNIEIRLEQDTQMLVVYGDYGRLRQMFLIILDNAVKFSPQGEVVAISLKDKTVSIRDHGIGIHDEDIPYIFDRFYKINSEENKSGSGLGLAIAKQIADRHHVSVLVNSKINVGTDFQFCF